MKHFELCSLMCDLVSLLEARIFQQWWFGEFPSVLEINVVQKVRCQSFSFFFFSQTKSNIVDLGMLGFESFIFWYSSWLNQNASMLHFVLNVNVSLRKGLRLWEFLRSYSTCWQKDGKIGRAHVWTPVTPISRMPSSAWKKKKKKRKDTRNRTIHTHQQQVQHNAHSAY